MSRASRPSTQPIEEIDETAAAPVLADSVADQLAAAAATESKGRSRRAAATQPPPPPDADEVSVVSSTSSKTRGKITTLAELSLDEMTERKRLMGVKRDNIEKIKDACFESNPDFALKFDPENLDTIELLVADMPVDEAKALLTDFLALLIFEGDRNSTRKNKDATPDGKRAAKKTPPAKAAAESAPASPAPQVTA